jgi:hypothetical protein
MNSERSYGVEIQPDSIPEPTERFGLQFPGKPN